MRLLDLSRRRVRIRFTLLYGALFVGSGAMLLTITYLLVRRSTNLVLIRDGRPTPALEAAATQLREQAVQQHQEELHHLLVESGEALAIMAVISVALGWLVAGRVIRPVRTMTATIRQISARNLHERLAVVGPQDELKDLADTVDGLLGRLETALDGHRRFVANAAHELRTPLTLEHALLEETLIDRDATLASFRSNFERLLAISEQQGRLLESLLTLSGSESGIDRREPMDLADVVDAVLDPAAGVRVETSLGTATTVGDRTLVERLVANLLDNAFGYNVPDGYVAVATGTSAGRAFVSVTNSGPIVPPSQVERLFEPFQRLHRDPGDGHHGLGLSIVRAIALAHDARLTASARPDGGLAVEVAFRSPIGVSAGADTPIRDRSEPRRFARALLNGDRPRTDD